MDSSVMGKLLKSQMPTSSFQEQSDQEKFLKKYAIKDSTFYFNVTESRNTPCIFLNRGRASFYMGQMDFIDLLSYKDIILKDFELCSDHITKRTGHPPATYEVKKQKATVLERSNESKFYIEKAEILNKFVEEGNHNLMKKFKNFMEEQEKSGPSPPKILAVEPEEEEEEEKE